MAGQRLSFHRLYNPLLLFDHTTKNSTNIKRINFARYEYSIRQRPCCKRLI